MSLKTKHPSLKWDYVPKSWKAQEVKNIDSLIKNKALHKRIEEESEVQHTGVSC